MSDAVLPAVAALNRRYLLDYPREAARLIEKIPAAQAAQLLARQPPNALVRVWQSLTADAAAATLRALPPAQARTLLVETEPAAAAAALAQFDDEARNDLLGQLDPQVADELRALLDYPEHVAGRMMDPRVTPLRLQSTVGEALARLKTIKSRGLRELFVVDEQMRLAGRVEI